MGRSKATIGLMGALGAATSVLITLVVPSGIVANAGAVRVPTGSPTRTTTSTAPNCGGSEATLVAEGTSWTCTFDSEFTGTSLNAKQWQPITTAASGYVSGLTACYVNSPNNISVGNGYLSLTVRKEAAPFTCSAPGWSFQTQYTSGTVATYGLFTQTYGRFEINAKFPASTVQGLQESLWMMPESLTGYGAWPASGEIDVAENYSDYANLGIPTIHYNTNGETDPAANINTTTNYTCTINPGQFNDYVLDWSSTSMRIYYNGKLCLTDVWIPSSPLTAPEPFNTPFFMNLTQALGIPYSTDGFEPGTTQLPATTEVKYVRVWKAA